MAVSFTNPAVRSALLFMPDISGFTEFVATNEILHAQHIIQEVLNLLVETNEMDLEVEEIEGDAVFFYRFGAPPSVADLLRQVHTMYTRFHQHLRQYEHQRLCDCTACNHAVKLQLKIFAHFGEVAGYDVKNYHKLFGKEVIVIHRLLKNSLHLREYILLTDPLLNASPPSLSLPAWFHPQGGEEIYDVGTIGFQVNDLSALLQQLPPTPLRKVPSTESAETVLTEEVIIPASAREVYEAVFNVKERCSWMDGVKETRLESPDRINRLGTCYRYEGEEGPGPVMVTASAQVQKHGADLVEMEQDGTEGRRYAVHSLGEHATRITISVLVKKSWWRRIFFQLFHRNVFRKKLRASLTNLKHLLTNDQ